MIFSLSKTDSLLCLRYTFLVLLFFFLRFVLPNEKENMMLGSYEGSKEYDENMLYENFNNDNFKKLG